jgi:V8-like Glu-specific endopeptidase
MFFVVCTEKMANSKCFITMDQLLDDPETQGAESAHIKDRRYLVKDANSFPYLAIAFMQIELLRDDGILTEYAGTGFLCKNKVFVTAAHNIVKMSRATKTFAEGVRLQFGVNGPEDVNSTNVLLLEGSDFSFPKGHKKGSDEYDIAWIDLQQYYDRKTDAGMALDWTLDQLPKQHFHTCSLPEQHGLLPGYFHICGKQSFFVHFIS